MRAAIFTGAGEALSIAEVKELAPGPRDVVVEIAASGVCHTDLGVLKGSLPYPPPLVLGHEACGRVTWAGSEVSTVNVGDLVISSPDPMCGRCYFCIHGQPNLCELLFAPPTPRVALSDGTEVCGMSGLGTFAEEMTVHEAYVVPIQSDLPPEQLALIGCGVNTGMGAAINGGQIQPGMTVAVIGCGGVGLSAIQGARLSGASEVIAVDTLAAKLEVAARLGATQVINASEGDPVEAVLAATGGRGVDVALEVVGLVSTTQQALAMARRGGTVVMVGAPPLGARLELDAFDFFMSQKRFTGSVFGHANIRRDFPRYVRLAERGALDLDGLISARISLDEVNDALGALERGERIRSVIVH